MFNSSSFGSTSPRWVEPLLKDTGSGRASPGGPVVKALRLHCWGIGPVPDEGTKSLHAAQHGQKKRDKGPSSQADIL